MTTLVGIVGQTEFTEDELHCINVRMWEQSKEAQDMRAESARRDALEYEYACIDHEHDEWPDWL